MSDTGKPPTDAVTVRQADAGSARPNTIVVMGDNLFMSRRLPRAGVGSLSIGRSDRCDIRINHGSVSRQHARIHVGDTIEIEDTGSSNGTVVRGARLDQGERAQVSVHDVITLGSVSLFLQHDSGDTPTADRAFEPIVVSPATRALYQQIDRVAAADINVLIVGETGAGKEVVAESIHRRSPRADGPIMRLNCAALPHELIESALFGHEQGAFTGATAAKLGLLEAASGGTVFLDEVGELPPAAQAKLLRALESGEVMRVGAVTTRPIDVRFIGATNRELADEIADGRFREDLYYRLNGITLAVPPLRDRLEELEPLAKRFVDMFALRSQTPPRSLSGAALDKLRGHDWPGNVRELRNVIERAAVLADTATIGADHIVFDQRRAATEPASHASERERIVAALEACAGNQTRAAQMLGISRRTLINRLEKYDIARPRKK